MSGCCAQAGCSTTIDRTATVASKQVLSPFCSPSLRRARLRLFCASPRERLLRRRAPLHHLTVALDRRLQSRPVEPLVALQVKRSRLTLQVGEPPGLVATRHTLGRLGEQRCSLTIAEAGESDVASLSTGRGRLQYLSIGCSILCLMHI